jgi:hypothetical protein
MFATLGRQASFDDGTGNQSLRRENMSVEEDGDEVFIPISDVRCCGLRLKRDSGFWKCPMCRLSYGPVADAKKDTKLDTRR